MCKQRTSTSIHRAALVATLFVYCATQVSWAAAIPNAPAGSITITSAADDGPGTLRAAIATAQPNDVITFQLAANPVITLTSGQLGINKSLVIDGSRAGLVTLVAGPDSRVLHITGGQAVLVALSSLAITGGVTEGLCEATPRDDVGRGGGIYADAALIVRNSAIRGNRAHCLRAGNDVGAGGGIYALHGLRVLNTRVESNSAGGFGGGIYATGPLTVSASLLRDNVGLSAISTFGTHAVIEHSTVVSNTVSWAVDVGGTNRASIVSSHVMSNTGAGVLNMIGTTTIIDSLVSANGGSGLYNGMGILNVARSTVSDNRGGGILTYFNASIVNSTISGNYGPGTLPGGVGVDLSTSGSQPRVDIANSTIVSNTAENPASSGIVFNGGAIFLQNSIVAGNGITGNFQITGTASLTSLGYNLTDSASGLSSPGDIVGADPLLGPLQANGGLAPTHAPLSNSPVIDAANPGGCADLAGGTLMADGRNYPRPIDGNGDDNARCDIGSVEFWVPSVFRYLPIVMKPGE